MADITEKEAIKLFHKNVEKANRSGYVKDKIVWALHQTWIEAGKRTDMAELKRCPFCGREANLEDYGYGAFYKINANHDKKCPLKKAMWAIYFSTAEEAIEAWNRRSDNG